MRRTDIIFVGMNPAHQGDPDTPLEGRIGKRFAKLLQITPEQFAADFERVNLNYLPLSSFDYEEAARRADSIIRNKEIRKVVVCGQRVCGCFWLPFLPLHTKIRGGRKAYFILPHPSGLNRWWNDPENVVRAGESLRTFVYGKP